MNRVFGFGYWFLGFGFEFKFEFEFRQIWQIWPMMPSMNAWYRPKISMVGARLREYIDSSHTQMHLVRITMKLGPYSVVGTHSLCEVS